MPTHHWCTGALTQLLEDEFDFVRCEAVRAVAALSLRSAPLTALGWDILVTMLYDDVAEVRVATLAAMRVVLAASPDVSADVCRTVRDALDDASSSVRLAAVRCAPGPRRRQSATSQEPCTVLSARCSYAAV